jgi:hypothetical protein
MRELEGMSYREIGQKLDLTRPAVESALFRARRRLESEYAELAEGRRCEAMHATIVRMADGKQSSSEEHRLARHVKRCAACRKFACELGVRPASALETLRRKAAALFPIPWFFRRGGDGGGMTSFFSTGANAAPLAERAAALVAAVALVGAGGAALGTGALRGDHRTGGEARPAAERSSAVQGESQRGTTGPATDGERAAARRASGRRASGPAGGRAGDSDGGTGGAGSGVQAPAVPGGDAVDSTTSRLPLPTVKAETDPSSGATQIGIETPEINVPNVSPPDTSTPDAPRLTVPPVEAELEVPSVESVTDGVTGGLESTLP